MQRIQHTVYGWRQFQPRCNSAILIVNPNKPLPKDILDQWRTVFSRQGMGDVAVVGTHADTDAIYGPTAAAKFSAAGKKLDEYAAALSGQWPVSHRVENYAERPVGDRVISRMERRWRSESEALEAAVRSTEMAQASMQAPQTKQLVAVGAMAVPLAGLMFFLTLRTKRARARKF
mmetsp:Transcript_66541/g.157074  ORF Transcript_66541/g.157074 Transcript_66541/m.157074 type:complete len:175 (+) Transcript_66541:235-759(+)